VEKWRAAITQGEPFDSRTKAQRCGVVPTEVSLVLDEGACLYAKQGRKLVAGYVQRRTSTDLKRAKMKSRNESTLKNDYLSARPVPDDGRYSAGL